MNEFRLIYYLKKDKVNPQKEAAIYAKLSVENENVTFSTRKFISKRRWDETDHLKRIIRNEEEIEIQNFLKKLEKDITRSIELFNQKNIPVTAFKIKQYLKTNDIQQFERTLTNSISLLLVMSKYIERFEEQVVNKERASATSSRYYSVLKMLEGYLMNVLKRNDIYVDEINYDFIDNLDHYLRTKKEYRSNIGCSNNTVIKYIRNIRTCCNYALKKGWIERNPFLQYDKTLIETSTTYLTDSEIESIEKKQFLTERLNTVRDIFLFTCFTSIAPCDIKLLTLDNIVEINGEKWIKYIRKKSKVPCDCKR